MGFTFALAVTLVFFVISLFRVLWKVELALNSTLFLGLGVISFLLGAILIGWNGLETFRSLALMGIAVGEGMMTAVGYETVGGFVESLVIQSLEIIVVASLLLAFKRIRRPLG